MGALSVMMMMIIIIIVIIIVSLAINIIERVVFSLSSSPIMIIIVMVGQVLRDEYDFALMGLEGGRLVIEF